MDFNEAILSGLMLERGIDTGSGGTKLEALKKQWQGAGFSRTAPAADVSYVTSVAADMTASQGKRFDANRLLALYYADLGEFKRSVYHSQLALTLATDHSRAAACHMDIFLCQRSMNGGELQGSELEHYDKFVEAAMKGIQAGESGAILSVLEMCEEWKDYALLSAAAQAWSKHPENSDDYDREVAESLCHTYAKRFQEQKDAGFREAIYARLPGEATHGIGKRAKLRANYLDRGVIGSLDVSGQPVRKWICTACGHICQGVQPPQACYVCKAPAERIAEYDPGSGKAMAQTPSAPAPAARKQTAADSLMEAVEDFSRKYGSYARKVHTAKRSALQDYAALVQPIIRELRGGNTALMRSLIEHCEVFEDMQDYGLLGAAATLWLIHPDNTDGREKIVTQKKSVLWVETAVAVGEAYSGESPVYERLCGAGLSSVAEDYKRALFGLTSYVRDQVQGIS